MRPSGARCSGSCSRSRHQTSRTGPTDSFAGCIASDSSWRSCRSDLIRSPRSPGFHHIRRSVDRTGCCMKSGCTSLRTDCFDTPDRFHTCHHSRGVRRNRRRSSRTGRRKLAVGTTHNDSSRTCRSPNTYRTTSSRRSCPASRRIARSSRRMGSHNPRQKHRYRRSSRPASRHREPGSLDDPRLVALRLDERTTPHQTEAVLTAPHPGQHTSRRYSKSPGRSPRLIRSPQVRPRSRPSRRRQYTKSGREA